MTIIPKAPPDSTVGLVWRGANWHVTWYVDGKVKTLSTRTAELDDAKLFRDHHYANLLAKGASHQLAKSPREKAEADPSLYIYARKPYIVKIKNAVIGEADTAKEAREIRNKYLKIK